MIANHILCVSQSEIATIQLAIKDKIKSDGAKFHISTIERMYQVLINPRMPINSRVSQSSSSFPVSAQSTDPSQIKAGW